MSKKLYSLLTLLFVAVFALAACQSAPAEEATEEPVAAEPTEEPMEEPMEEPTEEPMEEPTEEPMEEPTEEPVVEPVATLRVWADDTRSAILVELADDFLAAYNVEVIVEEVSGIRDQFIIAAPAGEGPDIIIGAHDWIGSLINSGLLAPLDLGDKAAEFSQVSLDGFTYTDGQLYGMPYAVENMAFFYNTDMVSEAPATWEDLQTVGQGLVDAGTATYAIALTGTTYDMFPLHTAFGGYIFGQDDAGAWVPTDIGIGSQGMIDAVAWARAMIEAGLMPESTDWDTAHTLFENGEIPFLMAGPWALDRIRASGVPYAITTFPGGGQPFAGVQGFMVSAFSENPLLAQAFLTEFVATEEVMTQFQEAGNRPSAFTSVAAASTDPDLVAFSEVGQGASLMPSIPEMGSVWGAWAAGVDVALQGAEPAETSMPNAASQIEELIAGALAGMVNIPGSWQATAGCGGDWDPACQATELTDNGDGTYSGTFDIPAGEYEFKVALDGSWAVNYGSDGLQDGPNYALVLDNDSTVTFTYDSSTNLVEVTIE